MFGGFFPFRSFVSHITALAVFIESPSVPEICGIWEGDFIENTNTFADSVITPFPRFFPCFLKSRTPTVTIAIYHSPVAQLSFPCKVLMKFLSLFLSNCKSMLGNILATLY